eukprot:CAMPEP_0172487068 /NCGR_PEP_ID=MMETSP1066-20121228/15930_1 /TAXON_ID=671091 /ORGANISM="Coscinodiscus wailesii, Strain CCMP2513" /LENGTH=1142 /DNA_ID=CAMNT_0013253441 /DNA_START=382 /DNA_END=3810 /DNA_ORIENTATION=+
MKSRQNTAQRWLFPSVNTFLLLLISSVGGQDISESVFGDTVRDDQCKALPYDLPVSQDVYTVGVLAIRGAPAAYKEFNTTFSDYLTATAGQRFEKPVQFKMEPLNFITLFSGTESSEVDFFYVNPSAYSCIESEFGAHSLVSQISKRVVGGKEHHLTQFGGVIFTRADSPINNIEDIKGKSVAAASISGLGSGQMQFRKLMENNLHYLNDPSQVVFTSNQGKVVNGVLYGDFDVGFVRTDQIERTKDKKTGELVDKSLLKIIDPVDGLEIDGEPFPFESSTQLYAEWNVASLNHVPNKVNLAVQEALLALRDHADVGEILNECYVENNCTSPDSDIYGSPEDCMEACQAKVPFPTSRCDTTPALASLAYAAKKAGKYTGWRSTLTYMELRNMQEETGFIRKNHTTGAMQCIRSKNIYDAVVCPIGHFKKSEDDVINGCALAGTPCDSDTKFQCVCKPCVKAFDVNVFPRHEKTDEACQKFSICGRFRQRQELVFLATDNKEREGMTLSVKMHVGEESRVMMAEKVLPEAIISDNSVSTFVKSQATNYTQMFKVASDRVGVMVMEVFADGEQIPESPFRVVVAPRDCSVIGANRVPDIDGNCVCAPNTVEMGNDCAEPSQTTALALTIVGSILGALVIGFLIVFTVRRVRAIRKLQRDHERKMLITLDEAMRSTINLDYPLHLVRAKTFLNGGRLRRHELMRDEYKLFVLDTMSDVDRFIEEGKLVVFFSHQWTAFDAPDHTGEQFKSMIKALQAIATIKGYHDLEDVWVWVDYSCIPQSNSSTQALAIRSLAPYASSACAFIVVAPPCQHKDLPTTCDMATYQRRMWCRAEQVCYLMRNGPDNMYIATGDEEEPFKKVDEEWFREALLVFHGELTCCRLEHKGMQSCDRQSIVVPILGLYGELYRATEEMLRREISGDTETGFINESVRMFMKEIEANQEEIFPRTFEFVTWRKKKKVIETTLLFGDLVERMRAHVDAGEDAVVSTRVFADDGPASDTIKKADPKKRRSSEFLRSSVVHGNVTEPQNRRRSSDFLRGSDDDTVTSDANEMLKDYKPFEPRLETEYEKPVSFKPFSGTVNSHPSSIPTAPTRTTIEMPMINEDKSMRNLTGYVAATKEPLHAHSSGIIVPVPEDTFPVNPKSI